MSKQQNTEEPWLIHPGRFIHPGLENAAEARNAPHHTPPGRLCSPPLLTRGALPVPVQPCSDWRLSTHHQSIKFPRAQPVRALPPPCCHCSHNKDKNRREAFLLSSPMPFDKKLSKHHLMWPTLQNPYLTQIALALDPVLNEPFGAGGLLDIWFHLTLQGGCYGWECSYLNSNQLSNSEIHIKSDTRELHFKTVRRDQTMEMERDNPQKKPTSTDPGLALQPGSGGLCSAVLKLGQATHCTKRCPSRTLGVSQGPSPSHGPPLPPANNCQVLSVFPTAGPSHCHCSHHFQPGPSY